VLLARGIGVDFFDFQRPELLLRMWGKLAWFQAYTGYDATAHSPAPQVPKQETGAEK
jgi:hypothetical protein